MARDASIIPVVQGARCEMPDQRRPALRTPPHHRPPKRLDRDRHHQRSHLAPV